MVLGLFGPTDEITAIFYLVAVVCFVLAAFIAMAPARADPEQRAGARIPGGTLGLIALGLGLWLFPTMWNTFDAAF